jgi:hypothetical protein
MNFLNKHKHKLIIYIGLALIAGTSLYRDVVINNDISTAFVKLAVSFPFCLIIIFLLRNEKITKKGKIWGMKQRNS